MRLLGWRHPGFSTHVGEPIPPNDARAIEDMASYVVRNPVSLKRLVYIDGQQAVIYRALRSNPSIGANFVALDPLEWLARITDHIPDPGRHRTLFYAHYANRARGARAREKKLLEAPGAEESSTRRCSPSWARLISKVYHADPLTCRRCGGSLQIVAYIRRSVHDQEDPRVPRPQPTRGRAATTGHPLRPRRRRWPRDGDHGGRGTAPSVGAHARVFAASHEAKVCHRGRSPRPPRDSHPHRARVKRR